MDLGMNSEARHAGKMFEVASTMLKNAVEAKNAKADKKLRMIELQLKKQRVDQQDNKDLSSDEVIEGSGYVVGDRNKLLDQLIQKVNETDDKSNKEDK
jgi:lysine/ornithine N-monooxygenase